MRTSLRGGTFIKDDFLKEMTVLDETIEDFAPLVTRFEKQYAKKFLFCPTENVKQNGGEFGRDPFNLNFRKFRSKTQWIGSVQPESFEKTGPPFEVDHFSRSDRLEFWLNGSHPLRQQPRPQGLSLNE